MRDHYMMNTTCPYCSAEMDCVSATDSRDPKPTPGDFSMCFGCGEFSVYDDNLQLREPSAAEAQELSMSTEAQLAKEAWMHVKEKQ